MHDLPFLPGASGPAGVSAWVQANLFERRVVFLTGELTSATATGLTAQLMTLDAMGDDPLTLYIDSPDAALEAAFVLIDTLKLLRSEVRAHCLGRVGGPAVAVLAVADRRSASPHARFRLAQPQLQAAGTADRLSADSQHFQDLLRRLQLELAEATGQPLEEVALDLRRGRYLDAEEALAYGLIDEITNQKSPMTRRI
jgi:ATP-dependent Clp protease, protease subunit